MQSGLKRMLVWKHLALIVLVIGAFACRDGELANQNVNADQDGDRYFEFVNSTLDDVHSEALNRLTFFGEIYPALPQGMTREYWFDETLAQLGNLSISVEMFVNNPPTSQPFIDYHIKYLEYFRLRQEIYTLGFRYIDGGEPAILELAVDKIEKANEMRKRLPLN